VEDQGVIKADGEGRWHEVLIAFLILGWTSFGGPIAHIGYFREAFVTRRRWLDADSFADLLALCQLLPGPASSQLGMAIGHRRAGWAGALSAWIGFTLPSALLMTALALGTDFLAGKAALIHGLKLAAVAVVAQAIMLMARQFASGLWSMVIAICAALACIFVGGVGSQIIVILLGGAAGAGLLAAAPRRGSPDGSIPRTTGAMLLALFGALLLGIPLAATITGSASLSQLDAYFRAGSLVFGGGHVVLPLLEQGVVATGAIDSDHFLAAYGAAQALPGPLFSVAAFPGFLGNPGGLAGSLLAVVAIFLPGALLLFGIVPFWSRLIALPVTASALAGANAAVVGLLAAALWDPLIRTTVSGAGDILIAVFALLALILLRLPPLLVVAGCVGISVLA
jgi:chromate transporter